MISVKVEGLPARHGLVGKTVIPSWIPLDIPAVQLVTWKQSSRDNRLSDALAGCVRLSMICAPQVPSTMKVQLPARRLYSQTLIRPRRVRIVSGRVMKRE